VRRIRAGWRKKGTQGEERGCEGGRSGGKPRGGGLTVTRRGEKGKIEVRGGKDSRRAGMRVRRGDGGGDEGK